MADDRGRGAESPLQIPAPGWRDILKRTAAEAKDDNVPLLAAGTAYYAILALFPALISAVTLWGLFAEPQEVAEQINSFTTALPPSAREVLTSSVTSATEDASSALSLGAIVGLATALFSASGGVNGMVKALNAAYDEKETRNFLRLRALSLVLTLGAIVGVLVSIGLIAVVPVLLDNLGLGPVGQFLARWGRWPLLAVLVMAGLAMLYAYAPDRENPELKWISPGAVMATVLWLIGSALFSLFVSNFGNYGATYGIFAGIIVLMLWLFLTGFVVIMGAEVNAEIERQTKQDTTTGEDRPMGERRAQAADTLGEPAG
jgi:membrane protein